MGSRCWRGGVWADGGSDGDISLVKFKISIIQNIYFKIISKLIFQLTLQLFKMCLYYKFEFFCIKCYYVFKVVYKR